MSAQSTQKAGLFLVSNGRMPFTSIKSCPLAFIRHPISSTTLPKLYAGCYTVTMTSHTSCITWTIFSQKKQLKRNLKFFSLSDTQSAAEYTYNLEAISSLFMFAKWFLNTTFHLFTDSSLDSEHTFKATGSKADGPPQIF